MVKITSKTSQKLAPMRELRTAQWVRCVNFSDGHAVTEIDKSGEVACTCGGDYRNPCQHIIEIGEEAKRAAA